MMQAGLNDQSRVWIYQSNRPFSQEEVTEIKEKIQNFAQSWVSHNRALKAHGDVYHNRFIVLMVDETQAGASGCSIDSSVRFLQQLQAAYGIDLFDRMNFSFEKDGEVHTVSRAEFQELFQNGKINAQTPVFDTLVKTKADFDQAFKKPLSESWHQRMVG